MNEWQRDALGAGLDVEALGVIADFVARGVVDIEGTPIEVLPGYWVIPGFLPYDGDIILATADRRRMHNDDANAALELTVIMQRAVAACAEPRAVR